MRCPDHAGPVKRVATSAPMSFVATMRLIQRIGGNQRLAGIDPVAEDEAHPLREIARGGTDAARGRLRIRIALYLGGPGATDLDVQRGTIGVLDEIRMTGTGRGHGPDRQFERLMNAAGRLDKAAKPILEINPRHERVLALAGLGDEDQAFKDDAAHLLYDEARVLDGDKPADARAFSERLARLIARGIAKG